MFSKRFQLYMTVVTLAIAAPFTAAYGIGTTVISNDDMKTWGFFEEIPNGTGQLIESAATPPLDIGSANMTVDAGRMLLETLDYVGLLLDEILYLEYSTYQDPLSTASDSVALSLQFNIDYDLTDFDDSWQGRLVFEPANNSDQGNLAVTILSVFSWPS